MTDAEIVLRKFLDKVILEPYKNGTVALKALNSGGANYTTALFSITISVKDEDDLKLFAKVANLSDKFRDVLDVKLLFDTEQLFYGELMNTYDKIQDKYNVVIEHRFKSAKFYGGSSGNGEEIILLEDLVCKGYCVYSRFKTMDWEHAATAVASLARFHALSFAFEREDPVNFAKTVSKLTYKPPKSHDDPSIKETWRKILDVGVQVAKEEHKEAASKFLIDKLSAEEVYRFKKPLHRSVLCHGDFRMDNLLFKNENGQLNTMVLDFQTMHTGCAPVDLLYLEFMGTDEEFRRQNHQRLVDYYFEELTLALQRLELDVNDAYPRAMFDIELKEMLPVSLRTASFILPMVLVEADRAPELGKIKDVDSIAISPNELFAERFSSLVSDCVRWGAI